MLVNIHMVYNFGQGDAGTSGICRDVQCRESGSCDSYMAAPGTPCGQDMVSRKPNTHMYTC